MKALILTVFSVFFAQAANAQSTCQNDALRVLSSSDPIGARIYNRLDADDKSFFLKAILCKQPTIVEIPQGVFEATRRVADVEQRYVLPNGVELYTLRMPVASLKPSAVADRFDKNVLQYDLLTDSRNFHYLLSAMNAHAVELQSALNLTKKGVLPGSASVGYRDRLAIVMLMVKMYLEAASEHKTTWDLFKDENSHRRITTAKVWVEAAKVMREACKHPNLGLKDLEYLEHLYSTENRNGLQQVLGGSYEANMPVECREINR